jgi:crossover junction endodeoxyribonuclease RuvC
MKVFIGIDPGKDGALAVLGYRSTPILIPFSDTEYTNQLRRLVPLAYTATTVESVQAVWRLDPIEPFCVVEHVGAMPGQGVTSCFSFGQNFGFILGLLTAFRIPFELARPQRWKREFGCTSDKNTSIAVAKRLFPDVDFRRTPQCKKPHDGICEALLMAEYARRLRS